MKYIWKLIIHMQKVKSYWKNMKFSAVVYLCYKNEIQVLGCVTKQVHLLLRK